MTADEADRIAVVGAGLGGLSCAARLNESGIRARIFDKGRGPGGRCSTRRQSEIAFDHGAQYFTARDERFRRLVTKLVASGEVAPWTARFRAREGGRVVELDDQVERFVGVPGMNALPKAIARELDVSCSRRIVAIEGEGEAHRWRLRDQDGHIEGPFEGLVLNMPPEQALALLPEDFEHAAALRRVRMAPSLALMLIARDEVSCDFDALFVNDDELLRWVARDGSKPGRSSSRTWVLHAGGEFSERHFEADEDEVAEAMLGAFRAIIEERLAIEESTLMRWRYALPLDEEKDAEPLFDRRLGIGVCGDWCTGGRVEGAWLAGLRLAEAML